MRTWKPFGLLAGVVAASALWAGAARATEGVDVSVYQGTVDWNTVKNAGIHFAVARVSDGTGTMDSQFDRNWSEIHRVGIVRGVYQFFRPGEDGVTQANLLINKVHSLSAGDLPPVLDLEVRDGCSDARIMSQVHAWVDRIHSAFGREPLIYTSPGFWSGISGAQPFGAELWVANWGVSSPRIPSGWSSWRLWQYSDAGQVAGISGRVDLDTYNGTVAQLQAYAGTSSTPPAPDYAANLGSTSIPATIISGGTAPVWIEYKNVGTKTWNGSTHLGTTEPQDHASALAGSGWLGSDRACAVGAATGPGGVGRFSFTAHAPTVTQATTITEHFRLVQEGTTWFGAPDTLVTVTIQILPIDWKAQLVAASFPATLDEGASAVCTVDFTNLGAKSWNGNTRLGTTDPNDHASPLYTAGSWINPTRAASVGAATAQGATGHFTFTITAPAAPQTFTLTEKFRLVQEGTAWFSATPDTLVTAQITIRHVPKPGNIAVVSDPPGAAVFLSGTPEYAGRYVGLAGTSTAAPLVIAQLPPLRTIHLRLMQPGLAAKDVSVVVPDNATVAVSEKLEWRARETYVSDSAAQAAGQPILARGGYAAPQIVDWNEDGFQDLVLGNGDGTVDLYQGASAQSLDLSTITALQAGGAPISVGGRAVPFVVDWDNDDKKDLLVGAKDGHVFLCLNTGSDDAPTLAAPVSLRAGGAPFVAPGGNASPWVVDWDGDGKKDVLVGTGSGEVLLLRNIGTDAAPILDAPVSVELVGKGALSAGADAAPFAIDLNNDGAQDLGLGSFGGNVLLGVNSGSSRDPLFRPIDMARLMYCKGETQTAAVLLTARIAYAETQGSGYRDLVVGEASGAVRVALGQHLDGDVSECKKVDARDMIRLLRAVGLKRGDATYAPELDLNQDGVIDDKDFQVLQANFGRTYQ